MLKLFEGFNKQMGGVDLFDQFVSTYRVGTRPRNGDGLCVGGKCFNAKCT